MEVVSRNTYSVMSGEPHLGKQIETIVEVTREEVIETLIRAFEEGLENKNEEVTIVDGDYEQTYNVDEFIGQEDIDNILFQLELSLLDDDYGTDKHYELLYKLLDDLIPSNFKDTFEVIEYR